MGERSLLATLNFCAENWGVLLIKCVVPTGRKNKSISFELMLFDSCNMCLQSPLFLNTKIMGNFPGTRAILPIFSYPSYFSPYLLSPSGLCSLPNPALCRTSLSDSLSSSSTAVVQAQGLLWEKLKCFPGVREISATRSSKTKATKPGLRR